MAQTGLKAAARSAMQDLALGLCAAGLAVIGAGFLLMMAFWALSRELGAVQAAGLVGVTLLVLAAVMALVLRARHNRPVPVTVPRPAPLAEPLPAVGDPAVMAVFVLGFVLSRHFLKSR